MTLTFLKRHRLALASHYDEEIPNLEGLEQEDINQGNNSSFVVKHPSGKHYLVKQFKDNLTSARRADTTKAMHEIGKLFGLPHPRLKIGPDNTIITHFLHWHKPLYEVLNRDNEVGEHLRTKYPKEHLLKHALFNYITNIGDRHLGNYFTKGNDDLINIDHEFAFYPHNVNEAVHWQTRDPIIDDYIGNPKNFTEQVPSALLENVLRAKPVVLDLVKGNITKHYSPGDRVRLWASLLHRFKRIEEMKRNSTILDLHNLTKEFTM